MYQLKGRKDGFRLIFPKEFLVPEIEEKYSKLLQQKKGFFKSPIDVINESIKHVDVLGFNNAAFQQQQPSGGDGQMVRSHENAKNLTEQELRFLTQNSEYNYRNSVSPVSLTDNTINVVFRHQLGLLNYFMIFENFFHIYARETTYDEMFSQINVDILNEIGSIYSRIVLYHPVINSMDMLSFDYTQPVAASDDFKVEFKYSNFDFQFIEMDD